MIFCNKPVKQVVTRFYRAWKLTQEVPAGGKYIVSRELLVEWIEKAVKEFSRDNRLNRAIYESFQLCGFDFVDHEKRMFRKHIDSLKKEVVYQSLLDNQVAIELGNEED